jgi:hypothetical protein
LDFECRLSCLYTNLTQKASPGSRPLTLSGGFWYPNGRRRRHPAALRGYGGPCVDIWEVGNEVNGNWLLNNATSAAPTMAKIKAMYNAVAYSTNPNLRSKYTALTFFYEGEPSDPTNGIATNNGGNDMFTWIQTNFITNKTAETEAIRTDLNLRADKLVSRPVQQSPAEMAHYF